MQLSTERTRHVKKMAKDGKISLHKTILGCGILRILSILFAHEKKNWNWPRFSENAVTNVLKNNRDEVIVFRTNLSLFDCANTIILRW
jgi:hypothetical protein